MSLLVGNANFMVIDVAVDGAVHAMHRENVLTLGFLGKQSIRRASDLVFNEDTQQFDIHLAAGNTFLPPVPEARGFPTYEAARQMEVRWLEMARLHGVPPASPEGRTLLSSLRAADAAKEPVHG